MATDIPTIFDCDCGLRYMKSRLRTIDFEIGHFRCPCGDVLGAWHGNYRLNFEPEDNPLPN